MRVIAGDVGGTKTLLRCVETDGGVSAEARYDSAAWGSFEDLLRDLTTRVGAPIDAACFAVAGPVHSARAEVTNLGWQIDERALATSFEIPRVRLVNDFYAVARGVPLLGETGVIPLQPGLRDRGAPIGILGAGTGLGQAIVTSHDGAYHVLSTEGGHADFAPQDEQQARLFLALHRRYGHVSWERLLSGSGLVNIFTFLGGEAITAAEVADRAAGGDATADRAFEIFVDLYGAEAGNLALRVLARGGIFLAGGIAAKHVARFTDGRFLSAFRRKGRFAPLLETIPVDLIVNEEVGLMGALEEARRMVR